MVATQNHQIVEKAFGRYRDNIIVLLESQIRRLNDKKSFETFCASASAASESQINYQYLLTCLENHFRGQLWLLDDSGWHMAREKVLSQLPLK